MCCMTPWAVTLLHAVVLTIRPIKEHINDSSPEFQSMDHYSPFHHSSPFHSIQYSSPPLQGARVQVIMPKHLLLELFYLYQFPCRLDWNNLKLADAVAKILSNSSTLVFIE